MDALYVYGYMRTGDVPEQLAAGIGDPPGPVETIEAGELAALVTPVEDAAVAPRRGNLLAHAEVLRRAGEHGPVLPLRFGEAVAGPEALRAQLADRSEE